MIAPFRSDRSAPRVLIATQDTTLLRIVAVLLIANSHLESLYPRRWMAADGLIGSWLFVVISGYSLVLAQRRNQRGFFDWYGRRILRLYPSLWIVEIVLALLILGGWRNWTLADYPLRLVWPTEYGFVTSIVIFYILYYFILTWTPGDRVTLLRLFWVNIALFVGMAAFEALHMNAGQPLQMGNQSKAVSVVGCFASMLMGGWLAAGRRSAPRLLWLEFFLLVALGAVYVGLKYEMVVAAKFVQFYTSLHLLTLAILFFAVRISWSRPAPWLLDRPAPVRPVLSLIGAATFEVYLVHFHVIEFPFVKSLGFPLDLGAFWIGTVLLALPVMWMGNRIRDRLLPKPGTGIPSAPIESGGAIDARTSQGAS